MDNSKVQEVHKKFLHLSKYISTRIIYSYIFVMYVNFADPGETSPDGGQSR